MTQAAVTDAKEMAPPQVTVQIISPQKPVPVTPTALILPPKNPVHIVTAMIQKPAHLPGTSTQGSSSGNVSDQLTYTIIAVFPTLCFPPKERAGISTRSQMECLASPLLSKLSQITIYMDTTAMKICVLWGLHYTVM